MRRSAHSGLWRRAGAMTVGAAALAAIASTDQSLTSRDFELAASGSPSAASIAAVSSSEPSPTAAPTLPPTTVAPATTAAPTTVAPGTAPRVPNTEPPPPPPADATASDCERLTHELVWPPGWQVRCAGPRSGFLGATSQQGWTEMYVRSGLSVGELRTKMLHEAGHAWDFSRLAEGDKTAQWCQARGCDPRTFLRGASPTRVYYDKYGAEDWAEVWSACHGGTYNAYLDIGPPSGEQCSLQQQLVGNPG